MVMTVMSFPNRTSGSDVVSITVKVWSFSSAVSSVVLMLTQPLVVSVDPEGKITSEGTKSMSSIAKEKC